MITPGARIVAATLRVAAARTRQRRSQGRRTSAIAAAAEPAVHQLYLDASVTGLAAMDRERVERSLRPPRSAAALTSALTVGVVAFDAAWRDQVGILLTAVYRKTRAWAASQLGRSEAPWEQLTAAASDPETEAVRWALTRAAEVVGLVTEDMYATVDQLVALAMAEGIPTAELARLITAHIGIGLSTRQMTSLLAAYQRLREAQPGHLVTVGARRVRVPAAGWGPDDVVRHLSRYVTVLRSARGLLVARTETIGAANAGQHAVWQRAVRDRWIPPGTTRRWSAAPTACARCKALHGTTAGMTEPFLGPDGPVLHPPAHPACRCGVVLDL